MRPPAPAALTSRFVMRRWLLLFSSAGGSRSRTPVFFRVSLRKSLLSPGCRNREGTASPGPPSGETCSLVRTLGCDFRLSGCRECGFVAWHLVRQAPARLGPCLASSASRATRPSPGSERNSGEMPESRPPPLWGCMKPKVPFSRRLVGASRLGAQCLDKPRARVADDLCSSWRM